MINIFFHPFFKCQAWQAEDFPWKEQCQSSWMVQGMGKREMGFYSEKLEVVWEYGEKCHECFLLTARPCLQDQSLSGAPTVKSHWWSKPRSCSPAARRGGHGRSWTPTTEDPGQLLSSTTSAKSPPRQRSHFTPHQKPRSRVSAGPMVLHPPPRWLHRSGKVILQINGRLGGLTPAPVCL